MKIVIALDSFKGTLTAGNACRIVADAIAKSRPDIDIVIKPMADGGEGTATAMIESANGRWIPHKVTGPLFSTQADAGFGWFESEKTAVVEMASASGLELLSKDQLNPFETTTFGTGQLIKAACDYGAQKILLAVGGSATVDGGIGAAAALGWKFLDCHSKEVTLTGKSLEKISEIVPPININLPRTEVLCDVENPLCGPNGAAAIYGPQKGATPDMVELLDKGLKNLAEIAKEKLDCEIETLPGAGAAGGLAAGAVAFMNASLVSGIETIIAHSNLPSELKDADWVITGEGSFDRQSLMGKVISGITKLAHQFGTNVAVIAGQVKIDQKEYNQAGIKIALPCQKENLSLDYALANCEALLTTAATELAKDYFAPDSPDAFVQNN
ncbi:MAG: glycerate kinase family protein [Planctomycetota bacterium]|jgi:glycerate kinase